VIKPDFPLFWDRNFARGHPYSIIEIVNSTGRRFLLNCQFTEELLLIPGRLTFGGFLPLDREVVGKDEFRELLDVLRNKISAGLKIQWKLPPQYFLPEIFLSQNEFLASSHFREIVDLNQHINVEAWETTHMSKGNQKKIRQCVSAGMTLKKASVDDLSKCYEVLALNREAIGAQVSMNLTEIQDAVTNFPSIYQVKYVEFGEKVAAMCLTVDIEPKVRYVLYWADNLSLRNYSPVAILCKKLVEEARQEGLRFLDLGISSNNGLVNEGLHRFKQNLGAITSIKKTILST
jgi:hypothetical protein